MTSTREPRRLGPKFTEALVYAAEVHAHDQKKGSGTPYIAHLLSVAALVIEDGGTETQAVAALLHDAPEDQGGEDRLADIQQRFGPEVAAIVAACSDTLETPKPEWCPRKKRYLAHLDDPEESPAEAVQVSLADKLDNARAILRDYRSHGPRVWDRFNAGGDKQLWYYGSLSEIFNRRSTSPMAEELDRVMRTLDDLVKQGA